MVVVLFSGVICFVVCGVMVEFVVCFGFCVWGFVG